MMKSLLIANRGEIAGRIMRTARRMNIRTIAVYSDADKNAPFVREADTAVHIGPAPVKQSYLAQDKILRAALDTGAEAVHPGYGFLSENPSFAESVIAAGLTWVGPPPAAIRAMGLKHTAKSLMEDAGVATTPGYLGDDQSETRLAEEAERIGWPVLIKAVAGGGGRGMRKVLSSDAFSSALASARREASASFGDDRVLLEKFVTSPRHIEVQIFADRHGNVVHLFERDCSLQRRHQKVIEEAPAPGMLPEVRAHICAAAINAARAVGYEGAGTVEFIAEAKGPLRTDRVWFMEMNTRLQVEHPVTELITGQDLVEWQLRIADGEKMPLAQAEIKMSGWAMEARLYAESPATGFLPSTGPLTRFRLPEGVRCDVAVEEGGEVTSYYDPLIAKIIALGASRVEAASRLSAACGEVEVWPVKTNAGFLTRILRDSTFMAGEIDTGFVEARLDGFLPPPVPPPVVLQAAAAVRLAQEKNSLSPWRGLMSWRANLTTAPVVHLQSEGVDYDIVWEGGARCSACLLAGQIVVFFEGHAYTFADPTFANVGRGALDGGNVTAPMPGRIVKVHVRNGDRVVRAQPLLALEAMKMEHTLTAAREGIVEVSVQMNDQVLEGAVLARIRVKKNEGEA